MSASDPAQRIQSLAEDLSTETDTIPVVRELLQILNDADSDVRPLAEHALLGHFEIVRRKSTLESLRGYIQNLEPMTIAGGAAREFIANAVKATDVLIQNRDNPDMKPVYNRLLRTLSMSFLSDGTRARCPQCGSYDAGEGSGSMYEFTEMVCRRCGYRTFVDDYQLEDWYPPDPQAR